MLHAAEGRSGTSGRILHLDDPEVSGLFIGLKQGGRVCSRAAAVRQHFRRHVPSNWESSELHHHVLKGASLMLPSIMIGSERLFLVLLLCV